MTETPHPNILIFETPEQVAMAAAERFVVHAREAIGYHQFFSVALSGGNTPRRMYELLATDPFRKSVDWPRVQIFFGDERTVPPDHPDSNHRLAYDALLSRVPIPPGNVHAISGAGDAAGNAQLYEIELKTFFVNCDWPKFDLVLLGLGKDGHTASLFPGTDALRETRSWVVANWVEALGTHRITLTAPAINAASNIEFMVTGTDKAPALAAILIGRPDPEKYPAQLISPGSSPPNWLVDADAASRITNRISSSLSSSVNC